MKQTKIEQLREILKEKNLIRAGDLDSCEIPRHCLASLVASGEIEKIARGVYAVVNSDVSSNRTLAEAALRVLGFVTKIVTFSGNCSGIFCENLFNF